MMMSELKAADASYSLKQDELSIKIVQIIDESSLLLSKDQVQIYIQLSLFNFGQKSHVKQSKLFRRYVINQQFTFSVKISQLSYTAFINFKIFSFNYNSTGPLATGNISIFTSDLVLRQGSYNILLNLIQNTLETNNILLKEMAQTSRKNQQYKSIPEKSKIHFQGQELITSKLIYQYRSLPVIYLLVQFRLLNVPVLFRDKRITYQKNQDLFVSKLKHIVFQSSLLIYDNDFQSQLEDPLTRTYYDNLRMQKADEELKPTKQQIQKMISLAKLPAHMQLNQKDQLIFYKKRQYITEIPQMMVRFVHSVNWQDQAQAQQAFKLLSNWKQTTIPDTLCLLSSAFAMNKQSNGKVRGPHQTMGKIRSFALSKLKKAKDQQLIQVILQLVQSLKYQLSEQNELSRFLFERAKSNKTIGNLLYWYLSVQTSSIEKKKQKADLQSFYSSVLQAYKIFLRNSDSPIIQMIQKIDSFRESLCKINKRVRQNQKQDKQSKVKLLRESLQKVDLGDGIPYALNPQIILKQLIVDKCTLFASKMAPFLLIFKTSTGSIVKVMYKNGDDLRQDQLTMQLFKFMDSILKNIGLDFKMLTYNILAFNKQEGFLQFVPNSTTFQQIQKQKLTISSYLSKLAKEETTEPPQTFYKKVLDNYIMSCAGFCTVTYFLGVGDRHLQNILIDNQGRFFHIDFGFILGMDPKFFATQMKLTKQMVTAMGQREQQFKIKCVQSFLFLRRRSRQIINMIQMMFHSGIKDLTRDSLAGLVQRFLLDKNQKQAQRQFSNIIQSCKNAIFGNIINDGVHTIAVSMRN